MMDEKLRIEEMIRLEFFAQNNIQPDIKADTEIHKVACKKYLDLATAMPYKDIHNLLIQYDILTPKMDEIKFVSNIQKKYNQTRSNVLLRIRAVRKLMKYGYLGD